MFSHRCGGTSGETDTEIDTAIISLLISSIGKGSAVKELMSSYVEIVSSVAMIDGSFATSVTSTALSESHRNISKKVERLTRRAIDDCHQSPSDVSNSLFDSKTELERLNQLLGNIFTNFGSAVLGETFQYLISKAVEESSGTSGGVVKKNEVDETIAFLEFSLSMIRACTSCLTKMGGKYSELSELARTAGDPCIELLTTRLILCQVFRTFGKNWLNHPIDIMLSSLMINDSGGNGTDGLTSFNLSSGSDRDDCTIQSHV